MSTEQLIYEQAYKWAKKQKMSDKAASEYAENEAQDYKDSLVDDAEEE